MLWTYSGERLDLSGEMQCNVVYKNKHYSLPVVVVKQRKAYTTWQKLAESNQIGMGEIFSVSSESIMQLPALLSKYNHLFSDSYAGMTGLDAHITMKGDVKPIFGKAHRVPYALKEQAEKELIRQLSPIVVVPKSDNTM